MTAALKWGSVAIFWGAIGLFLHYSLPQRDIVYVTGVEVKREDYRDGLFFGTSPDNVGAAPALTRDVRFIDTVRSNGGVMVYRNEDTGWGWPFYFKFNSADLQAKMRDLASTSDNPKWVAIRHYGWRFQIASLFPNAVGVWEVDGPDAELGWPWFNIVFLTCFVAVTAALLVRWLRFKSRRLDPMVEKVEDRVDIARQNVSRRILRVRRWWSGFRR